MICAANNPEGLVLLDLRGWPPSEGSDGGALRGRGAGEGRKTAGYSYIRMARAARWSGWGAKEMIDAAFWSKRR